MTDVVFYEAFEEEQKALKKYLPANVQAQFTGKTIQEEGHGAPPSSVISIRTQSRVPLDWAPKLKGILTRSQGFDHLVSFQKEASTRVPCGYLGPYCDRAVAEHAVLATMALLRKLKSQLKNFETFNRDRLTGRECKNKRALVVGVGNIGSEIVEVIKALGMWVKGVDILKRHKDLTYVSLEKGIEWAQIIFCAMPLTAETRGMLNYAVFKKSQPGLVFINISRGEISPIADLKKLLEEGILAGVSIDVPPEENSLAEYLRGQRKEQDPLIQTILELKNKDNVLFTPHNAFNTAEALEQKAKLTAEALKIFGQKGKFPQPVLAGAVN